MVQGKSNLGKVAKPKKGGREKTGVVKRGARIIAPKKQSLIKQRAMDKKLTANINKNIERQMSVKANAIGKLTIMKKLADDKSVADKSLIKRSSNKITK